MGIVGKKELGIIEVLMELTEHAEREITANKLFEEVRKRGIMNDRTGFFKTLNKLEGYGLIERTVSERGKMRITTNKLTQLGALFIILSYLNEYVDKWKNIEEMLAALQKAAPLLRRHGIKFDAIAAKKFFQSREFCEYTSIIIEKLFTVTALRVNIKN